MSGHKRTKQQREQDLIEMANMMVDDVPQVEIAKRFNLSKGQISKDIAEIRRRWKKEGDPDLASARAKYILELKQVKACYKKGWEGSLKAKEVESQEKTSEEGGIDGDGNARPGRVKVKAALRREGQVG